LEEKGVWGGIYRGRKKGGKRNRVKVKKKGRIGERVIMRGGGGGDLIEWCWS
jgi:hypothetical protein